MPDPWQRRHWRLAVRVHHRIADGVDFAFSRRLNGVCLFLTLLERGGFRGFFVRLTDDERIAARHVNGERLVIRRRRIVVRQHETGSIADERAGTEALLAEAGPLSPPGISSLVKYRNPATPMATREITVAAKGHIQFGVAEAAAVGGFFSCGVE